MKCEIKTYDLGELCQVVPAKLHILQVLSSGKVKKVLYVSAKYELGSPIAIFTEENKKTGYYLISKRVNDLLYYSFLLNSSISFISLHNQKSKSNLIKGSVTKTKLIRMQINVLPKYYTKACNILQLMIECLKRASVDIQDKVARDATISFLENMRNYIALEIYMNPIFEKHQISILKPWTNFIDREGKRYRIRLFDKMFVAFYKEVINPKYDIIDAMNKVKLFICELGEIVKREE